MPYLGISVSWIDEKWALRSCVYDFIPFRGSHTGANIFEAFDESIGRFREKMFTIALDNASNNTTFINECIIKYEEFGFTSEYLSLLALTP